MDNESPKAEAREAIERAAQYVLANSRRSNASLNDEQRDADTTALMTAYRDIIGKAIESGELTTTFRDEAPSERAMVEALELCAEHIENLATIQKVEAKVMRAAVKREPGTPYAVECHHKATEADELEAQHRKIANVARAALSTKGTSGAIMNLKSARKKLGMSLSEFAEMHGVSPLAARRWEYPSDSHNYREPHPAVIRLTQAYLDGYEPKEKSNA